MRLKDYSFILICVVCQSVFAQYGISGKIIDTSNKPLDKVEIFDQNSGYLTTSDSNGYYKLETNKSSISLAFFRHDYKLLEKEITLDGDLILNITLEPLESTLNEVEIVAQKKKVFALRRLKDVEGTAIFAGKKTEVILIDQSMASLATNNARQIYNQVAGLNIFQNDDAGLQLNIGGRGLDPNRTSNFNTRQNGYDISADVLGYPESYYTPPPEALSEIQIVRGAASLQYGTQFGGMINFKFKAPEPYKTVQLITRNTLGSNGLFTNFTSLSGTRNKLSYYAYVNYKNGDGFRPNSEFKSINTHLHLGYQFNEQTKLKGEMTYQRYLTQQPGGLSDAMYNENAFQSNRPRNWFEVDWLLFNLNFTHNFSEHTNFSFMFFGLNAERNAIGIRNNREEIPDNGGVRDLIVGKFNNYGFETRFLSTYKIFNISSTGLIGAKFYKASNISAQGPGSDGEDANFNFQFEEFPNYRFQSNFDNPNLNLALFGENIFNISKNFSITPGFRLEYINTESEGFRREFNFDGAGNIISDETVETQEALDRTFILLGLGLSYKFDSGIEVYANVSENYRSVTFSDININNPTFLIDPNITDEDGFTTDLGIRGRIKTILSFDASLFALFYNNRIGSYFQTQTDGSVKKLRANIGDASIIGLESLIDVNLRDVLNLNTNFKFNSFFNSAILTSEYTSSEVTGVKGNKVEYVPELNIKVGFIFGYKNFQSSLQYTYLSEQFSDAFNTKEDPFGNFGTRGPILSYDILDLSLSYTYKNFKIETGINNMLDKTYFTRRATGYPGPGIITSPPRNWFTSLEIKF